MVVQGGPPPGPDGPFVEDASIELSPDAPRQTWQYASLAFFPQGPNRDQCPIGTTYAQIIPDNAMQKSCILTPMVGYTKQIVVMGQQPRPGGLGPDGIPTGISPEARQQILEQRRRDGEGKEEGKGLGKGQGQESNDILTSLIYPIETTKGVTPAQAVADLGMSLKAARFPAPRPPASSGQSGILQTPPPVGSQGPPSLGVFRGGAQKVKSKIGVTTKPSTVTVPSALSQLVTSLANIDANTASMNENMAALLEAFNTANPPQAGGRRRQTKVKRKGKARRTTRR